ncbi:MAG TPA: hypothetical protein ENK57_05425 [Polyangiaceae bacterium]|nr:hypothetical protein [Polyangiaceae bacterium]
MLARTARALGLATALVVVGAPALAQPSNDDVVVARETFRAGEAAYQRGDYEAAANSFEVSYRLAPHPFTMFNAGLAWQGAKQPERAADAFHRAITLGGLDDDQLADATERLGELRQQLGAVRIEGPDEARVAVGHVDEAKPPVLVHLLPGDHEVLIRHADGTEARRTITVSKGETTTLTVDLPTPKPEPEAPAPDPVTFGDDDHDGLFIGGWVAVGLGVAAGGTAIGLGIAALSARDDFEASGNTDADARSDAATLRTVTNVMWGVAGAGVVTGTILLIVGWPTKGDGLSDLSVDLGPGYVGLSGAF